MNLLQGGPVSDSLRLICRVMVDHNCGEGILDIVGLATWLHKFLQYIGIIRTHIVGNRYVTFFFSDKFASDSFFLSMGCQVAVAFAALYPEHTQSVSLVGPTPGRDIITPPKYLYRFSVDLKMLFALLFD